MDQEDGGLRTLFELAARTMATCRVLSTKGR